MVTPNWFRRRRKAQGLTIRAIAGRCGVTETTVSNWESGAAAPEPSKAKELAAAYEVELDFIAVEIVRAALAVSARRKKRAALACA